MLYNLKKMHSIFQRIAYGRSEATAFSDMLDAFLVPFRIYPSEEERRQAIATTKASGYISLYSEWFQELGLQCEKGLADPLGEFYMLHISHGKLGQYFTPELVCTLQAQIAVFSDNIPGRTILDPACGSGRLLLAVAKINRSYLLYGADLDPVCCKMAVTNMLLNSLTGEIAHMNSLTNQFHKGYKLNTRLIYGAYYPCFEEFTDPEHSYIWLRPPGDKAPLPKSGFPKKSPPRARARGPPFVLPPQGFQSLY